VIENMESHFQNVFNTSAFSNPKDPFIPSGKFQGQKIGYCFKNGDKGIGYYLDKVQLKESEPIAQKRKFEEEVVDEEDDHEIDEKPVSKKSTNISSIRQSMNIDKLLEESEKNEVIQLTPDSVRQLLSNLDKKIHKNQKMRMKYSDEPEKFMESELELHQQIEELHILATSPELFSILYEVESHGLANIVNLISHENTDVCLASISFLQEIFDIDLEELQEADQLISLQNVYFLMETFIQQYQGLEILIQTLTTRLHDEEQEEDAQGVYHICQIIENIFDLTTLSSLLPSKPLKTSSSTGHTSQQKASIRLTSKEIGHLLCSKTNLLSYLLIKIQMKTFTMNKSSCAEVLTILLQSDEHIPLYLLHLSNKIGIPLPTSSTMIHQYYHIPKSIIEQTTYEKKNEYFIIPSSSDSNSSSEESKKLINGLELLLQAIAIYRKRDITIPEEQECIENIFLSLKTMLLCHPIFQEMFVVEYEGIELMLQCIAHKQYVMKNAFQTLNYVLMYYPLAGYQLIQLSGLKYLFPYLLSLQSTLHPEFTTKNKKKSSSSSNHTKKLSVEKQEKEIQFEESLISSIGQLMIQSFLLSQQQTSSSSSSSLVTGTKNVKIAVTEEKIQENIIRFYTKFQEHDYEKLEYILQLFHSYAQKVIDYEKTLQSTLQQLEVILREDPEDMNALDEYELLQDEEYIEQQRMDAGLFLFQQMITIISGLLAMDLMLSPASVSSESVSEVWKIVISFFQSHNISIEEDVLQSLREMIVTLPSSEEEIDEEIQVEDGEEAGEGVKQKKKKQTTRQQMEESYRTTLIQWSSLIVKKLAVITNIEV